MSPPFTINRKEGKGAFLVGSWHLLLGILPFCLFQAVLAQDINQVSSGTSQRTTVNFSNSFGVYTQLNTTPNVAGTVDAKLNIEPGSSIKSDFGGDNSALRQAITVTPTSSTINIEGIKSANEYRIAPGTSFSSELRTLSSNECAASKECSAYGSGPAVGTGGSGMQHVMSLTVDQTSSTFSNSFSRSF